MSNEQNPMVQVLSIIERLAGNPSSNLTATNVTEVISSVHETVMNGYKKVAEFQASTSLSTAERPTAEITRTEAKPETAVTEAVSAPSPTRTVATSAAPVSSAPKAAAKATDAETVKSPAPKQAKTEEKPAKVEETVAEAEVTVTEPELPLDEDGLIVASMIEEHGSAVAALAVLEANRKRGRKAAWHKMIEAKADEERRAAPMKSAMVDPQALAEALKSGKTAEQVSQEQTGYKFAHISRVPFMDPEKAIGKQKITCLIDGVARTMMSRYLKSDHNMTPEEYVAHFGLRSDYPMTSPTYREEKRRLAEVQKLGKRNPEPVKTVAAAKPATPASTNRRTRQRKAA